MSELMQMRLKVGSSISADDDVQPAAAFTDANLKSEPGLARSRCKSDQFGLMESGSDLVVEEKQELEDLGFDNSEFHGQVELSPREAYAEDPHMQPFIEELELLEEDVRADMELEQKLITARNEDDEENRRDAPEQIMQDMVNSALNEQSDITKKQLKMTTVTRRAPSLLETSVIKTHREEFQSETGKNLVFEKIFENMQCHHHKQWIGHYDNAADCGDRVFAAGGRYFHVSTKSGKGHCEMLNTAKPECPDGYNYKGDLATYKVYERDIPIIWSMYPTQGSVAGGQLVTILGNYLYQAHENMQGKKDEASSLRAPVLIKLISAASNFSVDCPLENFESRPEEVKCVTPMLDDQFAYLAESRLRVEVFKLDGKTVTTALRPKADDVDDVLSYSFSNGATPELSSVNPVSAGPGTILTIQAYSCSGIVEGDPVQLVKIGMNTSTPPPKNGTDAEEGELVADPEEAYGHICEPWPPINERYGFSSNVQAPLGESSTNPTDDSYGAVGLDAILWTLDDRILPTSAEQLDQLVKGKSILEGQRWIAATAWLDYAKYWTKEKKAYVAKLEGRLKIDKAGEYEFSYEVLRKGFIKIDGSFLTGLDRNKGKYADWGHHGKIRAKKHLAAGWHKVEFVNAVNMDHIHHTAMKVYYKGQDTSGHWLKLPQLKLRAGITREEVQNMEQTRLKDSQEKYLVPSEEIFEAASKAIGAPLCPPEPPEKTGKKPKLVQFRCKISEDMESGYYDVKFKDHAFGDSVTPQKAQFMATFNKLATMRVLPVINEILIDPTGQMKVSGHALDALQDQEITYNGYKYAQLNGTQDTIQLVKGVGSAQGTKFTFGARGLLRETWQLNEDPPVLDGEGKIPAWERATKLVTEITEASKGSAGFAERLTGLFVPPFSGECRFRMKGKKGATSAKLWFNEEPMSVNAEVKPQSEPPKLAVPIFAYVGREFNGNKDFEDLASVYQGPDMGGQMSFAWTSSIDSNTGSWSRILDWGSGAEQDNILIARNHRSTHLSFVVKRKGQGGRDCHAHHRIKYGTTQDWLITVTDTGVTKIYLEGVLVGVCWNGYVPNKVKRSKMFVGKSNWNNDGYYKGSVKDLRIYNRTVIWGEAYPPSDKSGVGFELLRYDMHCRHGSDKNVGNKNNVLDCAKEVHKQGYKYFRFGKLGHYGKCYAEGTTDDCKELTPYHNGFDLYKVVPAGSQTAAVVERLPFPENPVVAITDENEKASLYMKFTHGEVYPFKLERHVAGRTLETGPLGWSSLGAECRTIEVAHDPSLVEADRNIAEGSTSMLPPAEYLVQMKMKEYQVDVILPSSATGYDVTYKGRTASITKDTEAGPNFMSLFGPTCTVTKAGGTVERTEFDDSSQNSDAYCGTGVWQAPLDDTGAWTKETVKIGSFNYKLKEKKYMHMCYKIAVGARVNMLVKAKVGYRNHEQWFSIGITDKFQDFQSDKKRAAQWPIHTVDGKTTGDWRCASINLFNQVMAYDDYERRFHHIDYNNPSSSRGPGAQLSEMTIRSVYLGTATRQGSRGPMLKLEGAVSIDTFVVSTEEFSVTRGTSTLAAPLPWTSVKGYDTFAGWQVEWFEDDRSFFGTPGKAAKPITVTKPQELKLDNCNSARPPLRDCNHYGWRATASVKLPANKKVEFYYWNDDNFKVWINDELKINVGCCCRNCNRKYTLNTGAEEAIYKLEVHLWQGGGGNYGRLWWKIDGKDYWKVGSDSAGVSTAHKLTFKPPKRSMVEDLQKFLSEVTFTPKTAGETLGNKVAIYPGVPPPATVTVKTPVQSDFKWAKAVMINYKFLEPYQETNIGKEEFNNMFKRCPVVKYMFDAKTHSIYIRKSAIPSNFDAFNVFTNDWAESNNKLGTDFDLYTNEDDLSLSKDKWTYCNYGHTGYPRDCGPRHHTPNYWFKMLNKGGPIAYKATGFLIYNGAGCPSSVGTAYVAPQTASFAYTDTPTDMDGKIKSVLSPAVDVETVVMASDMKWLDMTGMSATQSSTHGHGKAELAIDGQPSKMDWNERSVTHTGHDTNAWWTVNLKGTYNINKLRITARNCCTHHLRGVSISVDGKVCHENLQISDRQTVEVPCIAKGASITVFFPNKKEHLSIAEVQVGTYDGIPEKSWDTESSSFAFKVTYGKPGYMPPPIFSSDLASEVKISTISSGSRFFPGISDNFFRMPHDVPQVSFGHWSEYICDTGKTTGCAPVPTSETLGETPPDVTNETNLTQFLQRHAQQRVRITTHNRRHPQRKWRLPPRYHTEETLEKLRRRVFGQAEVPSGWEETASLLQVHYGNQERHFAEVDPREDPNKMPWSAKSSWGGEEPPNKDTTDIVFIPEGKTALLDMNVYIKFWVIEGNVVWDMTKDIHMEAEAIVVNGGQLLIGSEQTPYTKQGLITLHGHWHTFKLPLCGAKTIFQTRGNIEMHGIPIATTWSELELTAFPGDTSITVRGTLDWKLGSLIIIAASDRVVQHCRSDRRDLCQVEERFVSAVKTGPMSNSSLGGPTTIIVVDRPLVYRHLAEEYDAMHPPEYCEEDPTMCALTQVRAEVGLLTRNIKVKGSNYHDGSGPAGSEGFGGHLMHAEKAKYAYVEFFWVGQAFQMGRYPLHLHLTGVNPTSYIKGCAIHRTFMRGVTVHGTHQAVIKDNVLYNNMAHGYFIEDGNEHNNIFENNLGMMTHISYSVLVSDQTPACFWLRNPSNYFRNNHAAGGAAFGFWFETLGQAAPLGIKEFLNNTAHSNGNTGVWIDFVDPRKDCTASDHWTIKVPSRDSDAVSHPVHDDAPQCGDKERTVNKLISITTWGNAGKGITLFETGHLNLVNHRSVNDGMAILVWGIQSSDWPDPLNNFNGPTLLHGSFRTVSGLSEYFKSSCGIGGPWDDTLMVYGNQFIGPVKRGHFCPCFECLAEEGGYEIRTSKLGWHEGAGTKASTKVNFPWVFSSNFFDFDGTLTEDTMGCKQAGCYLHGPFDGERAGMYSRRDPDLLIPNQDDAHVMGSSKSSGFVECKTSMYHFLKPEDVTASSYYRNRGDHGKGEMFRSHIGFVGDPPWCANRGDANQWVQYDFKKPMWITGVQTRGRVRHDQWVKKYKIRYSEDGSDTWTTIDQDFVGNRNRDTIQENRFAPIKATKIRLVPTQWHHHISLRLDFIGCDGEKNLTYTCMDKPYLNADKLDCRGLERKLGTEGMDRFCKSDKAKIAMHTALSADQACCACGAGVNVPAQEVKKNNTKVPEVPKNAPIKVVPGGTGYLPPDHCHAVDETGGIVCGRVTRINSITIKDAGVWHMMTPIDVQSDYGFSEAKFVSCYRQYEFTVMTGMRFLIVPPYTPKMLVDWDVFSAEIKMSAGDAYVLQWETIHNPDGYTVEMDNVKKHSICDKAEMQYDSAFKNNESLQNMLKMETDMHSAKQLGLSTGMLLDMYKVAHIPLLDRAAEENSAGMWGYIQANTTYDTNYWFPGMFNALVTEKGVAYTANSFGPWNGVVKRWPGGTEKWPTRNVNAHKDGAQCCGFSQIKTPFSWKRWDLAVPPVPGKPLPTEEVSRLFFLVNYCGVNPAAFDHMGPAAMAAVVNHTDVKKGKIVVPQVRRFKWSEWPQDLGGKPTKKDDLEGFSNITIEQNWEVTLDEDVDFINKLNISGVLKFADQVGCCKLVARYIVVGPLFGRLEAGTVENPISKGKAHIVLKGHPMTPPLRTFRPHIYGSAKWLKSKFIAVQGVLSLHGTTRTKLWSRLATSVKPKDSTITIESGDFKAGDTIAIDHGIETRKVVSVAGSSRQILTLDSPLENSYRGADHVLNGKTETQGMMAAYVGLIDGMTVEVQGEDTPGVPMCHKSETKRCPYAENLGGGMNLHDFAKEMRHYLETTGAASHPNCRPCLAVSELGFSGYVIGMAHFHYYSKCPKDHGMIDVTGVYFNHGSNMRLYHGYTGGNYPYDVGSQNFPAAWSKQTHAWWTDPVWSELDLELPTMPTHVITKSSFNNTFSGAAFALANAGVQVFPTAPVSGNVILGSGVGINGAARRITDIAFYFDDKTTPHNDNWQTISQGVGAPMSFGTFGEKMKYRQGRSSFEFKENFLIGSTLSNFKGGGGTRIVTGNVITGPVYMDGCPTTVGQKCFAQNTVNHPGFQACLNLRVRGGTEGASDNTVFGCGRGVMFNENSNMEGAVRRMNILDSKEGIFYWAKGPDGKRHDLRRIQFEVTDTKIYARQGGGGIGLRNPAVHAAPMGQPAPNWHHGGSNFFPMGHSAVTLFFKSMVSGVSFIGYNKQAGGVAITIGEGRQGDYGDMDHSPMFTKKLTFDGVSEDSKMRWARPTGYGTGNKACIQIDCDGRRNSLVVDEDGSLMGTAGTIISNHDQLFDKLRYVDPLGFDTMEDLVPMPARYDAVGDAIPFPKNVPHGSGGGLEYKCVQEGGCPVVFMNTKGDNAGKWTSKDDVAALAKDDKIVAIREDGGHIFLDPIFHGWMYATGTIMTKQCEKTMDPLDTAKPESQHARRYGRVLPGEFGTHLNASKIPATKGPVYTVPGIYQKGCTLDKVWNAYKCPGSTHRHLLIEVMDWNHMVRRWAPVSVEVNDNYGAQGGAMNIMSGPAMFWTSPMQRLQTFHALGHVGLRHNIYFSADPPSHLRLHLQYAEATEGVIACVYYGLPNTIQAYVNGAKKEPLFHATWDNLKFQYLQPTMEHGTYYYDRVGVETLRPGYLYTVIKGDKHADFKISHKIVLTAKVTVTTGWGNWKNDRNPDGTENENNNDFYKRGLNGLVRNIALLIGAPPTRVAILGQGRAKKGTFWNEKTTSADFAKWMWEQNKSMSDMNMTERSDAPGAELKPQLLQTGVSLEDRRHIVFLEKFAEGSRSIVAEVLADEHAGHKLNSLPSAEQDMVHEYRMSRLLAEQGDAHYQKLQLLQEGAQERYEEDEDENPTSMEWRIIDDDIGAMPSITTETTFTEQKVRDAGYTDKHTFAQEHLGVEASFSKLVDKCQKDPANPTELICLNASKGAAGLIQGSVRPGDDGNESFGFSLTGAEGDLVPDAENPLGWDCAFEKYSDGTHCDCDCGIWDPDCDLPQYEALSKSTPSLLNSTEQILILDRKQVDEVMLNIDTNFNFILDADEVLKIGDLGSSALYGVAQTINQAQEIQADEQSTGRKGNFAWLQSVPTSSCDKLLAEAPLAEELATYQPKCVKDTQFKLALKQPTGRCALEPTMQVGSQCHIPGGGFYPSPPPGANNTYNESICGTVLRIFRGGFGKGLNGAGVGPSSAMWFHPGGIMVPKAAGALEPINMKTAEKGLQKLTGFQDGMSFYCRIKFNSWHDWGRIFSFFIKGSERTSALYDSYMHAFVHNGDQGKDYASKMMLGFDTFQRANRRRRQTSGGRARTPKTLELNKEMQLLFTIDPVKAKATIWKNGKEFGMDTIKDFKFSELDKSELIIGRDARYERHYLDADISDIRVWPRPVTWAVATAGNAPAVDPAISAPQEDDPEDKEVPCITSKKNSWDFACTDDVTEELAKAYGLEDFTSQEEVDKFEKRSQMGDITKCTSKASTKGVVFAGKFGDGLTAEYYRMRTHCHNPPFTFGQVPSVVRVDKKVEIVGDFMSSYNEYAILWSGKILIHSGGTYEFEATVNDGVFISIDSSMVIKAPGCRGTSTHTQKSESMTLTAGGHDIAILYYNKGPEGLDKKDASLVLKYKGPDTKFNMVEVQTEVLGSDPLRLAKLAKDTQEDKKNKTNITVMPYGKFIYDEEYGTAVMPAGSCDLQCERGLRKSAGAVFKFFCKSATEVSFKATVSDHSEVAMIWFDTSEETVAWQLQNPKTSMLAEESSLLQTSSAVQANATMDSSMQLDYSLHTGQFKSTQKLGMDYHLVTSTESPSKTVAGGTHTLTFQGRMTEKDKNVFALKYLEFVSGKEKCQFYLEGKDTHFDQC